MNNVENKILNWEEFFISIAKVCSMRSKDPHTKVGCCIIDENNRIISTGYNGLPLGLKDANYSWNREGKTLLDTKYPYVIHAETNAILFAKRNLENHKLYTTLFPCSACTKLIIQSGIKKIFFLSDKYKNSNDNIAAKKMLVDANVVYKKINDNIIKISIENQNNI